MNDLSLSVDLTAIPAADSDSDNAQRRLRRSKGLSPLARMQAADRAARGDRIAAQRVGDRYRVLVEYTLGDRTLRHASLPVFRTADEARTRGEHFLLTMRAKEVVL